VFHGALLQALLRIPVSPIAAVHSNNAGRELEKGQGLTKFLCITSAFLGASAVITSFTAEAQRLRRV
jgi:hypothetical protein